MPFYGKQAVNTLQAVRATNTGLDRAMQQSFLKRNEGLYTFLADLLFAQGRLAEGQQVMAMLKETEYYEFIERAAESDPRTTRAALTPEEEKHNARYQEISGRIVALGKEHSDLVRRAASLTEAEKRRKKEVQDDLKTARKQYLAFLDTLEKELPAGGEQTRRVTRETLENVRPMSGVLKDLGHGAVLLRYLMAEERLWILLTTPEQLALARQVNIAAADLNKKIAAFRAALTNRRADVKALGKELHDLLIQPVAEDLRQAHAQTLMLSLDGALRYLPLAALHDGEKYLVERYALAVHTEVAGTDLHLKQPPQPEWRFAGFGVTKKVGDLPALKGVRAELDGIKDNVLPGSAYYDADFNAASFRNALDQSPAVAHVASHFVFRPGNQQDSYLLLGDGDKLTLAEIREEDYPFGVDLVALSACETAMGGGRDENGREVESFGVLAQQQGAKSVLATLWPVADKSTGDFMQLFYGLRQKDGLTKAEALRRAQLAFIEKRVEAALDATRTRRNAPTPLADTPADHPYFWAPFILMGNWL